MNAAGKESAVFDSKNIYKKFIILANLRYTNEGP